MKIDFAKAGRKIIALISAIVLYYIIHEGAHLLYALATNTFEKIVFMFPGMQIKVDVAKFSQLQLGVFNIIGAVATLGSAYILFFLRGKIATVKSNIIRAIFYYVTILFLLNDPVYLSILCDLFGGGDMNGIKLLMPEVAARIMFGLIGLLNLFIIFKYLVPTYKQAFVLHNNLVKV